MDGQVGGDLFGLRGVRQNPRARREVLKSKLYLGAEQTRKHELAIGEHLVKIDGLAIQDLFSAEGGELLGDDVSFVDGALNLIDVRRGRRAQQRARKTALARQEGKERA